MIVLSYPTTTLSPYAFTCDAKANSLIEMRAQALSLGGL